MCFEGKQYKCGSGGGHGGGKPMEMRWWWWKEIHINVLVVAVMEGKLNNYRNMVVAVVAEGKYLRNDVVVEKIGKWW